MSRKIIIDAYRGGDDIGIVSNGLIEKDLNLKISKYIYNRLREHSLDVSLTRNDDSTINMEDRINKIKSFYGNDDDVIVISNALSSSGRGVSINYALRNSDKLSKSIALEIEKIGGEVDKLYQRRLPFDTTMDYNMLIRNTSNSESLIIYYGNPYDNRDLNVLKNIEKLGEAVVRGIVKYLGLNYFPLSNYYIVKKGDTIYSIAKKYNVSIDKIKEENNLSSNLITIDQLLKIPS